MRSDRSCSHSLNVGIKVYKIAHTESTRHDCFSVVKLQNMDVYTDAHTKRNGHDCRWSLVNKDSTVHICAHKAHQARLMFRYLC